MFVRKKRNRSGTTSVVIVDKSVNKYKEIKKVGCSSDPSVIENLFLEAKEWIKNHCVGLDIFKTSQQDLEEKHVIDYLFSNIDNILLNGGQILLNAVFSSVGFDAIEDPIFKSLVVARLCQPLSKLGTVDYLKTHFDEDIKLHKIYRYLDKLYNTQQDKIQQISVEHTRKILGGQIGLMFYDVTTLYFETDQRDELRQTGFSKDGKHSHPQIVLGLLTSKQGYPLSYAIFNGSQFEGRTMIPIIDDFVQRFKLDDYVIVADSGLLSKTNIELLEKGNYKYIIGARIKNQQSEITDWILSIEKKEGVFFEKKTGKNRLIIGYTDKRAKKDNYNREKAIERLESAFKSGKITKDNINKKGYNKFIEISNNITVTINKSKINEDKKWDGLKGYITNTNLKPSEVYEHYSNLWEIERAYRITKGKIELRPMFVFNPNRIQAHICLCFVSYKLYKELERVLKVNNINVSVNTAINIAKTITTIRVSLPLSGHKISKTMILTPTQKKIEALFDPEFWKS